MADDYTGEVSPGGPAQTLHTPGLRMTKFAVGPMNNNVYLMECTATGDVLIVDAAGDPARILRESGQRLVAGVLTTHRHRDHWQALPDVVSVLGCGTFAHPLDAPALPVPASRPVTDGDVIALGELRLEVIHLAGHTPGGIALLHRGDPLEGEPQLWTGDSLFPGGVGKTTPDTFGQLLGDVETKIFARLPDVTRVFPGHGADTTLGDERPSLPEWRRRGW